MEYKGYKLERESDYFMVEIKAVGRGSVHKQLRGYFQTYKDAMKVIDQWTGKEELDG
jgi:hypothetical protein